MVARKAIAKGESLISKFNITVVKMTGGYQHQIVDDIKYGCFGADNCAWENLSETLQFLNYIRSKKQCTKSKNK